VYRAGKWWITALIVLLTAGCASHQPVPVHDRTQGSRTTKQPPRAASVVKSSSNRYIVRKGDTLFSIAFKHGLNYRTLARVNAIAKPYKIYPGQRLQLKPSSQNVVRDKSVRSKTTAVNTNTATSKSIKKQVKKRPSPPKTTVVEKRAGKSTPTSRSSTKTASASAIRWQWPTTGRLIASFKTKGQVNKGVNLAGRKGDPVYAAAAGEVVYAGSGLLGYGNLVIIDHNHKFLSAYAHNSRVLVRERDRVKGGEKIAEMGRSSAERVMLHFEIRRDGVPVNPLKYLPKKQ